ncbi:MAG TPA: hypothetical protein VFX80_13415 [Solirubrobacteraceae bacterium]|nr:hypothetical protein [Solirubrobacteraceae bacterium]
MGPEALEGVEGMPTEGEAERLKRARAVLATVNALNRLATKNDPFVVMDAARDWLAFMDKQAGRA